MKKFLLFILTMSIFSCTTTNQDVTLFLSQGRQLQYFFPERVWDTVDDDINLKADWLYRSFPLENSYSETIFNFTLTSKTKLFRDIPKSIIFKTGNDKLEVHEDNIHIIFIDQGRTRYTVSLKSEELDKIFQSVTDSLEIELYFDNLSYKFVSTKKFVPHIQYYKEVILGIL